MINRRLISSVCACLSALTIFVAAALAAAQTVGVRAGEHKGYSRIVFDYAKAPSYKITRDGDDLVLTVADPGIPGPAPKKLPAGVRSVAASAGEGGAVIRIATTGMTVFRHFLDGPRIAVDVVTEAPPPPKPGPAKPEPAKPEPPKPDAAKPAAAKVEAKIDAAKPEPAKPAPPKPEPVKAEPAKAPNSEPVKAGSMKPADAKSAAPSAADPAADAGGGLQTVGVEADAKSAKLTFPWSRLVAAAVFQRGKNLWIMFDQPTTMNISKIVPQSNGRVTAAETVSDNDATILKLRPAPGQNIMAARDGNVWTVELKDAATAPRIPVDVARQPDAQGNPRVFLSLPDIGGRIDLMDPDIGDGLSVFPVKTASQGVLDGRSFPEFMLLPTAQGVVVKLLSDQVRAQSHKNGATIEKAGGLNISADKMPAAQLQPGEVDASQPGHARLVDLEGWRQGTRTDFRANLEKMLALMSKSTPADRNKVRWMMAKFYLGHGMAAEAAGLLKLMSQADNALEQSAEFKAARGIARYFARRYPEAAADFADPGLADDPDIYLWRAAAAAKVGDWPRVLDYFQLGRDVLGRYNPSDRPRFQLAAIQAGLETGNLDIARNELEILKRTGIPNEDMPEANYLAGRLALADDKQDQAMSAFESAAAGGNRRIAAMAEFARNDLLLKQNKITSVQAEEKLERLRFAYRGDDFELKVLRRLGQMALDNGDYRKGLGTLRMAASYFGASREAPDITKQMTDVFRNLFLTGGGDNLPPIKALALYYDFRELTPLGNDGDEMIRNLADRLVSVELFDKAEELLEHQVKYRATGVPQAQVAARLAMVYLLDGKPQKALEILRATRQQLLPAEIETRRNYIEARALTMLKSYDEALAMLEKDASKEAELLRADIYWGAKDWPNVTRNAEKRLADRWKTGDKPLDPDERRTVLRLAIAQAMNGDMPGLAKIRAQYRKMMESGSFAQAFDVITSNPDRSGADLTKITNDIADVNNLEAFMTAYRAEFKAKG